VHAYPFFFQSLFMTDAVQATVKDLASLMLTSKTYRLGPFMVEGQQKYHWIPLFLLDIR
jgi:hypothetical protein